MEKMKSLVPMVSFCLYFAKGLVTSFTLNDILGLAVLGTVYLVNNYNIENKKLIQINEDLNKMKSRSEELFKRCEELKTHVSSLKIAQQLKPGNFR